MKSACATYTALVECAKEYAGHLSALSEKHYFSVLRNANGKLTLKVVKDRLAGLDASAEKDVLSDYLDTDKKQKAAGKRAVERFKEAESQFVARLDDVPLPDSLRDLAATVRYLKLLDEHTGLKARIKEAEDLLDTLAYEKYPKLSEAEIKTLVVEDKWMAKLATAVQGELDRVSQTLTGRIRELAERYATPLPQLTDEVATLAARVEKHLKRMGVSWT